jgi:hypothetical protein
MKQLHDLQGSDNAGFKQLTGTIAQKLKDAASSAASAVDDQQAEALNDLAAKFKTASETGKMPHLGHHGGHHAPAAASAADPSAADDPAGSSTAATDNSKVKDLLAMFSQNSGTDPMQVLSGILESVLSAQQS